MALKSRKEILRNLQNAKNVKYKSADFTPKRGEGVKQAFVYYSVDCNQWTPELIYIDNDIFNWLDLTKVSKPIEETMYGIAGKILHYDSFYMFKGKCLDVPCRIIAHGYFNTRQDKTIITPTFVIMNEALLRISDIPKQFEETNRKAA